MYDESRLEILLAAYLDQELTPDERKELEQMLLSSDRARQLFWERARDHFLVREWGMQEWGRRLAEEIGSEDLPARPPVAAQLSSPAASGGTAGRWRLFLGWGIAAAACVALLLVTLQLNRTREGSIAGKETPDEGVAVLTRGAGIVWGDASNMLAPGMALEPGWLRLKEGVVHLEFYSGARLIVEAPAELQLISATEVFCRFGKLNAYVPDQAHGFRLRSPEVDLVDLGTSFGMNIPSSGPSEVHVFDGKVELTRVGRQPVARQLSEGEAVQVDLVGRMNEIAPVPGNFVTLPELARRENEELAGRFEAWRKYNEALDDEAATLVHYTFEGEPNGDRRIRNNVRNAPSATEASIVSCEWVAGRWPGKPALEFKNRSDRVRLGIPGKHDALTYMAWVRIDSLPRMFNALFMSEELTMGEPRWDITGKGELRFSLRVSSNAFERVTSPPIITPDRFGQWLHLTTVYERAGKMVRHYVNGQEVASGRLDPALAVTLGRSEIGNWGVRPETPGLLRNDEAYLTRTFNGCFDEFLLSARAFTAEEIRQRYEVGKPLAPTSVAGLDSPVMAESKARR